MEQYLGWMRIGIFGGDYAWATLVIVEINIRNMDKLVVCFEITIVLNTVICLFHLLYLHYL